MASRDKESLNMIGINSSKGAAIIDLIIGISIEIWFILILSKNILILNNKYPIISVIYSISLLIIGFGFLNAFKREFRNAALANRTLKYIINEKDH